MVDLTMSRLEKSDEVEVVEGKGAGHPNTICDALARRLNWKHWHLIFE